MFIFTEGHTFYRYIGLLLALLQFGLFIFAFPPFEIGMWMQTEPVMTAMFGITVLDVLWMLWGGMRRHLVVVPLTPLFRCLFAWVGWQVLVTGISHNPWHSWFGPAEMGEGAGWHVMILLQALMLFPIWHEKRFRNVLLLDGLLNLAVQCALHAKFPQDKPLPDGVVSWAPGAWAAYLAFMAIPFWMGLTIEGYLTKPRRFMHAAIVFVIVLMISHNKTSQVLFPLALLISYAVIFWFTPLQGLNRFFTPNTWWRTLFVLVGCAVPVAWVALSVSYPAFPDKGPASRYSSNLDRMLSEKDGAMSTRLVFNKVGVLVMQHEPDRLWLGEGWGRFRDDLYKYVLVDGVKIYQGQARDPNWFMVDGYAFHSHNQPLEALLSLGIIGMVLWFAVPVAGLFWMPAPYFWGCAPLLVADMLLSSVWFTLPQCIPYLALVWVMISEPRDRTAYPMPKEAKFALVIAAVLMVWSGWQQWDAMWYGENLYQGNHSASKRVYDLPWVERDLVRGGERLREVATGYHAMLSRKTTIDKDDLRWMEQYRKTIHAAAHSPFVGVQVAAAEEEIDETTRTGLKDDSLADMRRNASIALPQELIGLLRRAPYRDDLATPYVLSLDKNDDPSGIKMTDFLKQLLTVLPSHRVALWRLGGTLRNDPKHAVEGIEMQERALHSGVETIYPLSEQDKAALQ